MVEPTRSRRLDRPSTTSRENLVRANHFCRPSAWNRRHVRCGSLEALGAFLRAANEVKDRGTFTYAADAIPDREAAAYMAESHRTEGIGGRLDRDLFPCRLISPPTTPDGSRSSATGVHEGAPAKPGQPDLRRGIWRDERWSAGPASTRTALGASVPAIDEEGE